MTKTKQFYLAFDISSNIKKTSEFANKILTLICSMDFKLLFIEIRVKDTLKIETKTIKFILKLFLNIRRKYKVQLKITFQCEYNIINNRLIRLLIKNNIQAIVIINNTNYKHKNPKKTFRLFKTRPYLLKYNIQTEENTNDIFDIYEDLTELNASVSYDISKFDLKNITKYFTDWIFNKRGIYFDYFVKCLNLVLFDSENDFCMYNSCLGKTLYMNENGDLSYCNCKNFDAPVFMCNIEDVEAYIDIFDNDIFIDILDKSKQFRNKCKTDCIYFLKCQGGCPINIQKNIIDTDIDSYCGEKVYIMLLKYIEEILINILHNNTLDELNPIAKKEILTAISFDSNIKRFLNN